MHDRLPMGESEPGAGAAHDAGPERGAQSVPQAGSPPRQGSERNETRAERMDRNWNELLQELRVVQTGVQVLSGFLLTLPFQQRFARLDAFERSTFVTAVVLAALTTALLVAPVSSHRLLFRKHEKDVLVDTSNRLAKAGLTSLALTMAAVILLVMDVVVGRRAGFLAAAALLAFYLVVWVVVPLMQLRRSEGGG